jgi:hypothetical protein
MVTIVLFWSLNPRVRVRNPGRGVFMQTDGQRSLLAICVVKYSHAGSVIHPRNPRCFGYTVAALHRVLNPSHTFKNS